MYAYSYPSSAYDVPNPHDDCVTSAPAPSFCFRNYTGDPDIACKCGECGQRRAFTPASPSDARKALQALVVAVSSSVRVSPMTPAVREAMTAALTVLAEGGP